MPPLSKVRLGSDAIGTKVEGASTRVVAMECLQEAQQRAREDHRVRVELEIEALLREARVQRGESGRKKTRVRGR